MSHTKKIMYLLVLLSFLIVLSPNILYGQNQCKDDNSVCFTAKDAKRLVVELERGRILTQNIKLLEKSNTELLKQTELLKEQLRIQEEKFQAAENLIKANEEIYNKKLEALQEELDEAKKPRWKSIFASAGVGALLTLVVVGILAF